MQDTNKNFVQEYIHDVEISLQSLEELSDNIKFLELLNENDPKYQNFKSTIHELVQEFQNQSKCFNTNNCILNSKIVQKHTDSLNQMQILKDNFEKSLDSIEKRSIKLYTMYKSKKYSSNH